MLTKVEARNNQGALLTLVLDDVSDGLILEDVIGLDPVKATISSSSFAQQDGTQYHSSRLEDRNIKLTIGLEPDYITTMVRDLRNRLYNYFLPKNEVKLRFYMSEGLVVEIVGRVESCEAPLFVKEPQMVISVLCPDPNFIDLTPVVVSGDTVSTTTTTTVTYDGTEPTGIVFVLSVDRTMTEFTIYHSAPDGTLYIMDIAAALVSGDVLTINTNRGSKGAVLTRTGSNTSLLYAISPQSTWISLQHGANDIRVYTEGAAVPYTITYMDRYGGL